MKIAFTSCICSSAHRDQRVWAQIAALQPDRLLLLGDAIYLDIDFAPGDHPKKLSATDFQLLGLQRYHELLAQPRFAALARAVPTDAIWDDHDFLWNESAAENAIKKNIYRDHIRVTRNLFNAFRAALDDRLVPGSFPDAFNDPRINHPDPPPPGYRHRALGGDVHLHLTDGRSQRLRKRVLLGREQQAAIEQRLAAAPDGVHLIASGSAALPNKGGAWTRYDDFEWLQQQAARYRILVLSGDIHENHFAQQPVAGGRTLFEATSSGAAVGRLVVNQPVLEHFGLLTVDADALRVEFFALGADDPTTATQVIRRDTWSL